MDLTRSLTQDYEIKPATVRGEQKSESIGVAFAEAMRSMDEQQHRSSKAMADVDSGVNDNLAAAMIESQKASVSFTALVQVRNKLVSAFDDVMRMPL
jgi:flagellar hook-basal body complex protein FliE